MAERAQRRYERAKSNCGAKTKLDDTTRRTIVEKLHATWSPEQIVGRLFMGKIAFSTIYRWIYAGRIDVPMTVLRQKGKRQKPTETRGRINIGLPIWKRPKEFSGRERIQATLGVPVYFADPYSSWQRGSNENANGLLREFFPKGMDFAKVTHDELADALVKINGRPRKCCA